jgi:putative phosphotransacetylase
MPITEEDIRIGKILMHEGVISQQELEDGISTQETNVARKIPYTLGEVLVKKGFCTMKDINFAMLKQKDEVFKQTGLGRVLVDNGFIAEDELEDGLTAQLELCAPLGEILIDRGYCTEAEVRLGLHIQLFQRNAAAKRIVISAYNPFNVMELIISEEIDSIIAERKGCFCTQCRSNVFAIALNTLPSKYVTDYRFIVPFTEEFKQDVVDLVRAKIAQGVQKVKKNPKAGCPRLSDPELLKKLEAAALDTRKVVVRVSNHHVHLSREHLDTLFGRGYELGKWKELVQPGQYAAKETVALRGPKGAIERVRVLGPARKSTQVEISGTDQFILGLRAPVRESGKLDGTPGIQIEGPKGSVEAAEGVIRARRHIHLHPNDASKMGLCGKDAVKVALRGDRTTILEGVLLRTSENAALEMHIDTDEANGAGVPSESMGEIILSG